MKKLLFLALLPLLLHMGCGPKECPKDVAVEAHKLKDESEKIGRDMSKIPAFVDKCDQYLQKHQGVGVCQDSITKEKIDMQELKSMCNLLRHAI